MDKSAIDIIGEAAAAGIAAGKGKRHPTRGLRLAVAKLHDAARANGRAVPAAREVLAIIRDYPRCEEFQLIAARLLDQQDEREQSIARWRGMISRFPHSQDAFCALLATIQRQSDAVEMRRDYRSTLRAIAVRFRASGCCGGRGATAEPQAGDMFTEVGAVVSGAGRGLAGDHVASWRAAPAVVGGKSPPQQKTQRRRRPRRQAAEGPARRETAHARRHDGELGSLLETSLAERGGTDPSRRRAPKSVMMIAGSLGAGGGERQFVYTALGLNSRDQARHLSVRVIVRSLTSRVDSLFFSKELERAGIRVQEIGDFPDYGGDIEHRPACDRRFNRCNRSRAACGGR